MDQIVDGIRTKEVSEFSTQIFERREKDPSSQDTASQAASVWRNRVVDSLIVNKARLDALNNQEISSQLFDLS